MPVIPPPHPTLLPVLGGDTWPVRRVYGVARNYPAHAQEMGFDEREPPFFFMKPTDAVVAAPPEHALVMPYPLATTDLHHEVELVMAIGRGGSEIPVEQALDHVWGYAVGLDLTRRDLQASARQQGRPWDAAKGFDASAPIGLLVPRTQATDPHHATLSLHVNGVLRQSDTTDAMIWNCAEIIAHLSQYWRLEPGDLILTGTPAGVGPIAPGDLVTAAITGLPPLSLQITR